MSFGSLTTLPSFTGFSFDLQAYTGRWYFYWLYLKLKVLEAVGDF